MVPRYATPPPSDGSSLTIKDLPLELFHIHIFPYLYDCELIRVAQLSRNFYVLSLPEFWKRCEALRLLDPNVFDPPCAEEVIVKRNLARYHKRMESLRALQGKEKGPYWKITVDTVDGFPKVTAWVDLQSLL